jgi:predicted ATPase/GAF domain-containing protein
VKLSELISCFVPSFLYDFQRSWYDSGLLCFNFATSRWEWSLDVLRRESISSDVSELVCRTMRTLSSDCQILLQYAACCGHEVTLQLLRTVVPQSMHFVDLLKAVLALERSSLMICTSHSDDLALLTSLATSESNTAPVSGNSDSGKAVVHESDQNSTAFSSADGSHSNPALGFMGRHSLLLSRLAVITLQFAHDKVQAAAFKLITPEELPLLHCTIAQQLITSSSFNVPSGHAASGSASTLSPTGGLPVESDEFAIDFAGHVQDGVAAIIAQENSLQSRIKSFGVVEHNREAQEMEKVRQDSRAKEISDGDAAWAAFFAQPDMVAKVTFVFLAAAVQAKKASAYASATKFLRAGISLIRHRAALESHQPGQPLAPIFREVMTPSSSSNSLKGLNKQAHAETKESMAESSHTAKSFRLEESGFERVSQEVWQRYPRLTFQLYFELCFCLFLNGRSHASQFCIEYVQLNLTSVSTERGQLWELHVQTLMVQGLMQEAVDTTLAYLTQLGVELETELSPELDAWMKGNPPFNGADESTYHHHPVFKLEPNPHPLAMNLLAAFTAALFFLKSALFPRVVYTMLSLTMQCGVTPESAFAFGLYSMTLWSSHNRYTENFSLGAVAKMLLDRFGEAGRGMAPRTLCAVLGDIFPWKKPLRWCNHMIREAFEDAFAQGDLEWGSYLGMYSAEMAILCGQSLDLAQVQQRAALHALLKKECTLIANYCAAWLHCSQTLSGARPLSLTMTDFDLPLIQFAAGGAHGLMLTIMNYPREAMTILNRVTAAKAPNASLPSNIPYEFYSALSKLACMGLDFAAEQTSQDSDLNAADVDLRANIRSCPLSSDSVSAAADSMLDARVVSWKSRLACVDAHIALLRIWSGLSPHTFEHKLLLVTAERHRILAYAPPSRAYARYDLISPAIRLYERAATLAVQNEYLLEAALALELASRFQDQLSQRDHSPASREYRKAAMKLYEQAGATAKVEQMMKEKGKFAADPWLLHRSQKQSMRNMRRPSETRPSAGSSMFSQESAAAAGSVTSANNRAGSHPLFDLSEAVAALSSADTDVSNGIIHDSRLSSRSHSRVGTHAHSSSASSSSSSDSQGSISLLSPSAPGTGAPANANVRALASARAQRTTAVGLATSGSASVFSPSTLTPSPPGSSVPQPSTANQVSAATLLDALSVLKATTSFSYETNESVLLQKLMALCLETAGASFGVLVLKDADDGRWRVELAASVENQLHSVQEWSQSRQPLPLQSKHSDIRGRSHKQDGISEAGIDMYFSTSPGLNAFHPVELSASDSSDSIPSTFTSSSSSPLPISHQLPLTVLQYVISSSESVLLHDPSADPYSVWGSDPYFAHVSESEMPKALLALPVVKGGLITGVLLLTNHFRIDAFSASSVQLLQLLCTHAALSIESAKLYSQLATHNRTLEQQVRERTTDLLVAKERAEKASAVKAEFLSSMSHEIRTPMNAVLGVGRLLESTQLSLEQQQYVSMISSSGQVLLSIVNGQIGTQESAGE